MSNKPLGRSYRVQIYEYIQQNPDLSHPQVAALFSDKFGFKVTRDMIRSLIKSTEVQQLHSLRLSENQKKQLDQKGQKKTGAYIKGINQVGDQLNGPAVTFLDYDTQQVNPEQSLLQDKKPNQSRIQPQGPQPQENQIDVTILSQTRGVMQPGLKSMMYGYGDVESPLQESMDLVEDLAIQYLVGLMDKAIEFSLQKEKITCQDVIFIIRKDPKKYARCQELLMQGSLVEKYRKVQEDQEVTQDQAIYEDTLLDALQ